MTRTLIALLLLGACNTAIPMPNNEPVDAPPGADRAQAIVVDMMSESFGQNLGEPPVILWFKGACLEYDEPPPDHDPTDCIQGRYFASTNEIHLRRPLTDIPSQSVIAHEHLHWALHAVYGDSDSDHTDSLWGSLALYTIALRGEGL